MNLASFYLCLFFSEAALKCDIVGKEENYKYLVALYTYHFYFFGFFFVEVCFWAIYDKKLKVSFILGYFVGHDNVEVEEKLAMCHAS